MTTTLAATLKPQLEALEILNELKGELAGALAMLPTLQLPSGLAGLDAIVAQAAGADPSPTTATFERVLRAVKALAAKLPDPEPTLAPLTEALELLEAATTQEPSLTEQISALIDLLEQELSTPGGGGFAGRIARLLTALQAAPQGQALAALLSTWLKAGGVNPNVLQFSLDDAAAALRAAIDALGGLMSLETLLAEGERLVTLMADRLDAAAVEQRVDGLLTLLDAVEVAGAQDPGGAVLLLGEAHTQVTALGSEVAANMGFGEATLLYLDLPRLQIEVRRVAATVSAADTAAVARVLEMFADRVLALAGIELDGIAERSFADLLKELESRAIDLAAAIAQSGTSVFTAPIAEAVDQLQVVRLRLDAAITESVLAARAALEEVRDEVASLPIEEVAAVLGSLTARVEDALTELQALVAEVKAEIEDLAGTATEAVNKAAEALEVFRTALKQALGKAAHYVRDLELDAVIGKVEEGVRILADQIAAFQMKPYVDTAVTTIDDTAAVIEKVPFDLLPSSMQAEVAALVEDVRSLDTDALRTQFEPNWAAIMAELEAAVEDLQKEYDALITVVRAHDPRDFAAGIDAALAELAQKVRELAPSLALEPVADAMDELRAALRSVDFTEKLAELQTAFDEVVQRVEGYSPAALVEPLQARVDAARDRLKQELQIDKWSEALTDLAQRAESGLALLDPQRAEAELTAAWAEAGRWLDTLPGQVPAGGLGTILTALLTGTGLRVEPVAFEVVVRWMGGEGAAGDALGGRTDRLAQALARARQAVEDVDPSLMLNRLGPRLQQIREAVSASPEGKAALQELELAVQTALGSLINNRKRYLTALVAAVATAGLLRQVSFSEVESGVLRLKIAFDPLGALWQLLVRLLARAGIAGLDHGLIGVLRGVLAAAPPKKVAEILAPILRALHALVSDSVEPVRAELVRGIRELTKLIKELDLAPLGQALGEVHLEIRDQMKPLSPNQLLGGVAKGLTELQGDLDVDPLANLEAPLTELRDGVARLLTLIDAGDLLAEPIAAWDEILATFGELDLAVLLAPVLESVAGLREETEHGFDRTVTAVERLQEALPA